MSYTSAAALQQAIFTRLSTDAPLNALVGDAIYDAIPTGTLPPIYVSLGPERVRGISDSAGDGAWHRIQISVVTQTAGFFAAKDAASAIHDALIPSDLILNRGHLVALNFHTARASRDSTNGLRRVDLIFRARIEDTPTS